MSFFCSAERFPRKEAGGIKRERFLEGSRLSTHAQLTLLPEKQALVLKRLHISHDGREKDLH